MNNNLSLVEKYRPNNISKIINQNNIINALKKSIDNKNIPHLLFYGSSGVGKTSLALSLAKMLFPPDLYDERILELNASNDRGIQIVREKIKNFAKFSINNNSKVANFKIIILDEADSLTLESQLALRYIIEHYYVYTRFIIICNYINKIIEPIISRCICYRFKPIKKIKVLNILKHISKKENINITNDIIKNIYTSTNGDLRYSINLLEKIKYFNNIDYIPNIIDKNYITDFFSISIKNENIVEFINNFINNANTAIELLTNLMQYITDSNLLNDKKKIKLLYEISFIDNNLNNGCDDFIQLVYLSKLIYNIYSN
tara:strand:- start:31 stop:978 length:948 start_codon:yes stop_codon:yes gene_type:complete